MKPFLVPSEHKLYKYINIEFVPKNDTPSMGDMEDSMEGGVS